MGTKGSLDFAFRGVGLLYNTNHGDKLAKMALAAKRKVDFVEVITENLMLPASMRADRWLESSLTTVLENFPISLHGISLSIGSADPIDFEYLKAMKKLIQTYHPICVSDHLVWCGIGGRRVHELLPIPYTEKTLRFVSDRIDAVQEYLGRAIAFENSPTYFRYKISNIEEADFLNRLCKRTGCRLLLDLNNLFINGTNNQFSPIQYLEHIDLNVVEHIHIAGFKKIQGFLFDSHDDFVSKNVWSLLKYVFARKPEINTVLEWDQNIPSFKELTDEVKKAKSIQMSARTQRGAVRPLETYFR